MIIRIVLTFSLLLASPMIFAIDHTGSILETMNSGGYTYAKVKENNKEYWIAGNQTVLKGNDVISYTERMKMTDFTSKTLNRKFDQLMFVANITIGDKVASPVVNNPHPDITSTTSVKEHFKKVEGGYTVAELFSRRSELQGKTVKVRGKVVKVNNGIMKSNWIHIQDGTGSTGTNDIVFIAKTETAKVDSKVIASGTLVVDKDFGYGYKYNVIIEDSSFNVEN